MHVHQRKEVQLRNEIRKKRFVSMMLNAIQENKLEEKDAVTRT